MTEQSEREVAVSYLAVKQGLKMFSNKLSHLMTIQASLHRSRLCAVSLLGLKVKGVNPESHPLFPYRPRAGKR